MGVFRRPPHALPEQAVKTRRGDARHNATTVAEVALVLLLVAACGAAAPAQPTPEPLSGTFTASGGGGALPAVQALTARFKELHPAIDWIVSQNRSKSPIKL